MIKLVGVLDISMQDLPNVGIEQTGSIFAVSGLLAYFLIPTFILLITIRIIRVIVKKKKCNDTANKNESAETKQEKVIVISEKQKKFNRKYRKEEDLIKDIPDYADKIYTEETSLTIYFDKNGKIKRFGGKH